MCCQSVCIKHRIHIRQNKHERHKQLHSESASFIIHRHAGRCQLKVGNMKQDRTVVQKMFGTYLCNCWTISYLTQMQHNITFDQTNSQVDQLLPSPLTALRFHLQFHSGSCGAAHEAVVSSQEFMQQNHFPSVPNGRFLFSRLSKAAVSIPRDTARHFPHEGLLH